MTVLGTSLHCWNAKEVPLKIEFYDSMGSLFILVEIHVMEKRLGDLYINWYWGVDKSLARPTSRCILFDGENISFDASLVIYIYIYI